MKKTLKMTNAGFTLVELMVVVGIIGVLASIALPQYKKFTAKARQTEVKLALGSAYTLEQSFATEQSTFTSCLGSIGFSRDGNKFYYAVGIAGGAGVACAADGSVPCNFTSYAFSATWAGVGAACGTNTINSDQFDANVADSGGTVQTGLMAQAASVAVTKATFTIGSKGLIMNGKPADTWTINDAKNLNNTVPGI